MALDGRIDELREMRIRITNTTRALAALVVALLAVAGAALAVTSATPSRHQLLAALGRPATQVAIRPMAGTYAVTAHAGDYRLQLQVGPNRAPVENALSLRVTEHGRPLAGAQVQIGFSMPAMNMWHVFTIRPAAGRAGAGVYRARVPIVGMSGTWQLRVRVTRRSAPPVNVNFNDRLGA
jgi:hypothetical protein